MDRREFLKTNATIAAAAVIGTLPSFPAAAQEHNVTTRGHNQKQVSLLGFGCMRLPMKNGEVDMELTQELFDYAVRHGVNYFDTAWPYLGGKSETATGALLKKYPRESFYLADKCPTWLIESPDDVDRIFDEQLKNARWITSIIILSILWTKRVTPTLLNTMFTAGWQRKRRRKNQKPGVFFS